MGKEVTFADVITDVRHELRDNGTRIADEPVQFDLTYWPTEPDFGERLASDRGIEHGSNHTDQDFTVALETLRKEFAAEISAIHKSLAARNFEPQFGKWQKGHEALYRGMNTRARALSVWENIAFPVRWDGKYVFRVWTPGDIGGSPIIHALPIDQYARAVTAKTAEDRCELIRLRRRLELWRGISVAFGLLSLSLLWSIFL